MQAGADPDSLDLSGQVASQLAPTEALRLAMASIRPASDQELKPKTGPFAGGTCAPSLVSRASDGRRRVALVIGNDNYSGSVSKLDNCVNDAKDMAVVLQKHHFMVMVVSDQTRSQMLACIRAFRQGIRDSDIVLVYFSGMLQLFAETLLVIEYLFQGMALSMMGYLTYCPWEPA